MTCRLAPAEEGVAPAVRSRVRHVQAEGGAAAAPSCDESQRVGGPRAEGGSLAAPDPLRPTGRAGPLRTGDECTREADAWQTRLLDAMRAARTAWLQVFGIPDYERYRAHAAQHHPGEPVLSEREFHAQAIDRKFTGRGPRCC